MEEVETKATAILAKIQAGEDKISSCKKLEE